MMTLSQDITVVYRRRLCGLLSTILFICAPAFAQDTATSFSQKDDEHKIMAESVVMLFGVGGDEPISGIPELDSLAIKINQAFEEGYKIGDLEIRSSTSPEGSETLNSDLSLRRAINVRNLLQARVPALVTDSIRIVSVGEDYAELSRLAAEGRYFPGRWDVQAIVKNAELAGSSKKEDLKRVQDGKTWQYMNDKFFPELRSVRVTVVLEKPEFQEELVYVEEAPAEPEEIVEQVEEEVIEQVAPAPVAGPRWFALKTNLLHDIALVPDLGMEFCLGNSVSLAARGDFSWWSINKDHFYWRTYGGEVGLRYWLGKRTEENRLNGHHIGLYGQVFTFDFETGGRGYLGADPIWAAGVEYGYSLPISKSLKLEFSLGVGYMNGKYVEYEPKDDYYVKVKDMELKWVGPTKAEVSLVWLIGR